MMSGRTVLSALLAAGAAGSLPAAAQDADRQCTGLANPDAEIACLRALLAKEQGDAAKSPSAASPASAEAPGSPRPPASSESVQSRLGAEQIRLSQPAKAATVRAREEQAERLGATIVETRRDRRGLLVMQLENGQIWRQDEGFGVPVRFDEEGRTAVEISRSGFGGYRMHFPEAGRHMVVSRLR